MFGLHPGQEIIDLCLNDYESRTTNAGIHIVILHNHTSSTFERCFFFQQSLQPLHSLPSAVIKDDGEDWYIYPFLQCLIFVCDVHVVSGQVWDGCSGFIYRVFLLYVTVLLIGLFDDDIYRMTI